MTPKQIQTPIDYKGKRYSGIYSVSGSLMIARIPGIGSKSAEAGDDHAHTARTLLEEILTAAEHDGMLKSG